MALPREASLACLPGGAAKERVRFAPATVAYPWQSHAAWFLSQMRRWGWLAADDCPEGAAKRVYAPDLLASAAAEEHLAWPAANRKQLFGFCDGAIFDQSGKVID
jgi:nitrate/nitrite transport system substrate-binding protein